MDFRPRHPQPFTLQMAIELDVPTITGEISRLQLSLQHLQSSQNLLSEHLAGSPPHDPDLTEALNENKDTIASQEERIKILRFALERKGVSLATNAHYDLPRSEGANNTNAPPAIAQPENDDHNGGLYL